MTIKIYKPSKSSMQSGLGKTKQWLAEYISEKDKTKDSLMGWNSSCLLYTSPSPRDRG